MAFYRKQGYKLSAGNLEPNRVKEAITKYVESYADARFSSTTSDTVLHGVRSGYWRTVVRANGENITEWLFTSAGLQEALKGLDIKRGIEILRAEKWLLTSTENGKIQDKTKVKVSKNDAAGTRFYRIVILEDELTGSTGSTQVPVSGTTQVIDFKSVSTGSTGSTPKQPDRNCVEEKKHDRGRI